MKLIDLSQPLYHDAPNCPAHPPVIVRTETHEAGAAVSWQMEFLEFASHTGSHVDAPLHRMPGGASLGQVPLESFVGEAVLADLRGMEAGQRIDPELLRRSLPVPLDELQDKILLLATGWGDRRAKTEEWLWQSPYIPPVTAELLVRAGIRGIGIDHYSVGGAGEENPVTHEILLGAGIWIVEELRFPAEVFEVSFPRQFMALPVNLPGASGAPCRPVLVVD